MLNIHILPPKKNPLLYMSTTTALERFAVSTLVYYSLLNSVSDSSDSTRDQFLSPLQGTSP